MKGSESSRRCNRVGKRCFYSCWLGRTQTCCRACQESDARSSRQPECDSIVARRVESHTQLFCFNGRGNPDHAVFPVGLCQASSPKLLEHSIKGAGQMNRTNSTKKESGLNSRRTKSNHGPQKEGQQSWNAPKRQLPRRRQRHGADMCPQMSTRRLNRG